LTVAVAFGWAVFYLAYKGGCLVVVPACDGAGALAPVALALTVGIVVAGAYWIAALLLGLAGRTRARLTIDLVVGAVALVHHAAVFIAESRSAGAVRSAAATAANSEASRRTAWIEDLRKDPGSHGPPGVVPSALSVAEGDDLLEVTNVTEAWLTVELARVKPDVAAPGGWRACPLLTAGPVSASHRFSLGPGHTARFTLLGRCAAEFKREAIEYRLGDPYSAGHGWWSDSAFAKPEGWPN
jgi:hypothetical protein